MRCPVHTLNQEIVIQRELKKAAAEVEAAYKNGMRPPQLVLLARRLYHQAYSSWRKK